MGKVKRQKGITLVALIITIIILLLLAVIILDLIDNTSIINYSKNVTEDYKSAKTEEQIKLNVLSEQIDDNIKEKESILPEEYQQLEYIQSTGKQMIDTKVFSQEAKIDITFKFNKISDKSQVLVNCFGSTLGWFGLNNLGNIIIGEHSRNFANIKFNEKNSFILEYKEGKILCTDQHGNSNQFTVTPNVNFSFFGYSSYGAWANIYEAKIYTNNELIRNFIPCYRKADGRKGLYDTVEENFYENKYEEDFIAGPEV